jgi:tetratricopeptide (TPR) repeat protein
MHKIDLTTAAEEIASTYNNDLSLRQLPFFFIIGAGVSTPTVPLAAEIIKHCERKARTRHANSQVPPPREVLDTYSYWFDRAYPQPIDRHRYLRSLIEHKPLTDASLRLAHILASKRIAKLVVTPNFDDFVSRALTVFDEPHIVCDHPSAVDRIDLAGADIHIVHVHGSYRFYDCCNLRDEVQNRAQPSQRTVRTMAAFLDRALSFSSPIVVGYAGWEGDVIMEALKRRMEESSLPYRLYWFCYEEGALNSLPEWLRKHGDVRFVLPKLSSQGNEYPSEVAKPTVPESSQGDSRYLPAQAVFDALIRAFNLQEPELTREPLRFFARRLRHALASGGMGSISSVYAFDGVVARIERAAALEEQEAHKARESQLTMEAVRHAVRRSRYREALQAAASAPLEQFTEPMLLELFETFTSMSAEREFDPEDQLAASNLKLALVERLSVRQDPARFFEQRSEAMLAKAEALSRIGKSAEALQTFDKLLADLKTASSTELQHLMTYAMSRKALALSAAGLHKDAASLYKEIIARLDKEEPRRPLLIVQSLFNMGIALMNLRLSEEAIATFEMVVERFRDAPDVFTQVLVGVALSRKAEMLTAKGDIDGACRAYDEVLNLYLNEKHPQVVRVVLNASLDYARLLARVVDKSGIALDVLSKVLKEYAGVEGAKDNSLLATMIRLRDALELQVKSQSHVISPK